MDFEKAQKIIDQAYVGRDILVKNAEALDASVFGEIVKDDRRFRVDDMPRSALVVGGTPGTYIPTSIVYGEDDFEAEIEEIWLRKPAKIITTLDLNQQLDDSKGYIIIKVDGTWTRKRQSQDLNRTPYPPEDSSTLLVSPNYDLIIDYYERVNFNDENLKTHFLKFVRLSGDVFKFNEKFWKASQVISKTFRKEYVGGTLQEKGKQPLKIKKVANSIQWKSDRLNRVVDTDSPFPWHKVYFEDTNTTMDLNEVIDKVVEGSIEITPAQSNPKSQLDSFFRRNFK